MALPPFLTKVITGCGPAIRKACPSTTTSRCSPCSDASINEESRPSPTSSQLLADPTSADAIKKAITAVTNTKPLESDIDRVRARLAAGGWPLADLPRN